MGVKHIHQGLLAISLLASLWLAGCQGSTTPMGTAAGNRNGVPQRVDIRGIINTSRYDQGQVVLEVEGTPSQYSRYDRAFVLVLPTTDVVDGNGNSISLSELQRGQNVAILLRSGGEGNMVGMGVARKVWVEEDN
ncbi:hypothetical protein CLV24_11562 [Pontibacter ummariensis]|uniref:DUF5666 domain-containing protein n=2 Tax=Pontibacter ummariensis TaxID=1610492 RepID=A0A239HZV7_9BACT|nr:hypothetical protein CLV24_11562 [Pontibacter ummariensis]SNS86857.1 hypothetical protein SAMN06296052_11562 [Pontibacter ummariensis]